MTRLIRSENRLWSGWRRIAATLMAMLFFLFLGAAAGFYGFLKGLQSPSPVDPGSQLPPDGNVSVPKGEFDRRLNVLLLGLDRNPRGNGSASSRADTIIFLSFDPKDARLAVVSIPRDTRVRIPGRGYQKVAHAHAYGGPGLMMKVVGDFLGIPVPHYVLTNFEGFERTVDMLGGVEIDVERDMYYEDPYQDLVINLKKGRQTLTGEQALQYVRYRQYPNGDIDRVKAQQKFLRALSEQLFRVGTIFKLPSLARETLRYVETNLEPSQIIRLASVARSVTGAKIDMRVVPGHFEEGSTDWVPDAEMTRKMIREMTGLDAPDAD